MPQLNERNVRHLLRRTEFVDRESRVTELLALPSFAAAVANVMAVDPAPPSVAYQHTADDENWRRGQELAHFWLDRMANDSPRPLQEKMALFWHGHLVSDIGKVGRAELMQEQIDLYRRDGLGDIGAMVKEMSTQVAMLRYLDNNRNEMESPNQNFARELMELFLLEVGNYTEADVEAATAAWTGHGDDWETGQYIWKDDQEKRPWEPMYHDSSVKQFLGQTINNGGDPKLHGAETIDVMLGSGVIPAGADKVHNRNRPSREVAAEFLSRKLWIDFGNQSPPTATITAMRDALLSSNFNAAPWVQAMLMSDEFYEDAVLDGLVRSPIDWVVSMLYALNHRSEEATPMWLMDNTGQEILRPPNVSGWKINGYYVNASAMEARARIAQGFAWDAFNDFWAEGGAGYIQFRNGRITHAELFASSGWPDYVPDMTHDQVIDTMADLMEVHLTAGSRQQLVDHIAAGDLGERPDALFLILLAPELHLA